ncbi:MAG: AsmA family protein [Magnetospirillum sp.]|nr:MAG: AsmA family protein [Magnetospirillum sp.]
MKRILVAVAILVLVAVGALVALPMMVPAEKIRNELVAQVKAATGRDLAIQGKVAVSVFPALSVEVTNVALSNPAGFTTRDLVRLGAVDVKLKIMPILSGRVEVDSFVLVDPVVSLETDRQGRTNWTFETAAAKDATRPGDPAPPASGGAPLSDIRLGDVRIVNGRLTWLDGKTGAKQEVSEINLAVQLPGLDSPLAAKGGLTWQGKTVDLGLDVAKPRALLDGKVSEAGVSVAAEPVKLSFKGQLDAGRGGIGGDLDLAVPSIRALVLWTTTKPLEASGSGLGPLSVKGKLAAGGGKMSFTQATIAIDAIKAAGDVAVDSSGARPSIKGRLDVETLDLNPYLPSEEKGVAAAKPGTPAAAKARADWSDDPIDASGLKAVDLDFALSVQAIKVRAIQVGRSAMKLAIIKGHMTADLTELALYQGSGRGRLGVDGSAPGVGLDAAFTLKGLKAEPFLKDAAAFERLDGTAAMDIQISGKGRSQRQLVSDLDGKGQVAFTDGAITGINLAAMVRNAATAFTDAGAAQKTDFAELSGSFVIANGTLSNKDLALKSPLLRVEGAGTVDLPKRRLAYRIEPKVAATLEGQGSTDAAGIMVPVVVEGPWDNLSYRPDLAAMAKQGVGKVVEGVLSGKGPTSLLPPAGGGGGFPLDPRKLFGR